MKRYESALRIDIITLPESDQERAPPDGGTRLVVVGRLMKVSLSPYLFSDLRFERSNLRSPFCAPDQT